jgi:hypothetical protein
MVSAYVHNMYLIPFELWSAHSCSSMRRITSKLCVSTLFANCDSRALKRGSCTQHPLLSSDEPRSALPPEFPFSAYFAIASSDQSRTFRISRVRLLRQSASPPIRRWLNTAVTLMNYCRPYNDYFVGTQYRYVQITLDTTVKNVKKKLHAAMPWLLTLRDLAYMIGEYIENTFWILILIGQSKYILHLFSDHISQVPQCKAIHLAGVRKNYLST